MNLGLSIRRSCDTFRQGLARLADRAFGGGMPAAHDETARGEFISAFISEHDLNFPRPAERGAKPRA